MDTEKAIGDVLEGMTPIGPVTAAAPLAVPQLGMNRAQRRKASAFSHSAKWKRMVRASEQAAIRKLNKMATARRALLAAGGDPED